MCRWGRAWPEGSTRTALPPESVEKVAHEFRERINGVVSVAKIDPNAVSVRAEGALVRAEVARHHHLRRCRVAAVNREIVVFEPVGGIGDEALASLAESFGMSEHVFATRVADLARPSQCTPVMKFTPSWRALPTFWTMHRMRYSGDERQSPVILLSPGGPELPTHSQAPRL